MYILASDFWIKDVKYVFKPRLKFVFVFVLAGRAC